MYRIGLCARRSSVACGDADTELYFHLLGLMTPWRVESIELSVEKLRVDVKVDHPPEGFWQCPPCIPQGALYDHSDERSWRHLDSCQFATYLHARIPLRLAPLRPPAVFLEFHQRFGLDGAQTELVIFALQLLNASLLLVPGRRKRQLLGYRATTQTAIAFQVPALHFSTPVCQIGRVYSLAT